MRTNKRIKKHKSKAIWPLIYTMLLGLMLVFNWCLPSYAQTSGGYHDIADNGRPRAAFSSCCCKKGNEINDQVFYSCNYVEANICPEDSKQYKVSLTECPGSLILTKYVPQIQQ
ncbi:MAG: hypothetical protein HY094_10085 [Candidatus Melainabacteria bacterium]|nr:hypothetical protein [Candidatus Melainabacteria bacterium]